MFSVINGGFKGFVYSDLTSIEGIVGARVAKDNKEAAVLALKAGLDMDLGGNAYGKNLQKALEEGAITMDDLNRAVANVLRLKFRMGCLRIRMFHRNRPKQVVRSKAHKELAREVAVKGLFY